MTWIPDDTELDAVARSLPAPGRDPDRIEQERTSVLAQAAGLAQLGRTSRLPRVVLGTAFAAAAAVVIWMVARPSEPAAAKETIIAIGSAHYERTSAWPDFTVRLDEGRLAIGVAALAPSERFRAITSDAEIEVRGGRFVVGAEHGRVAVVSVSDGRAELRWAHQPPVFVAAGETWFPPRIVQRDAVDLVPSPHEPAPIATPAPVPAKPSKRVHRVAETPAVVAAETKPTTPVEAKLPKPPEPPKPAVPAPRPGEAEFRVGVAALRAGDAATATQSFASACTAAKADALGEDACFWLGAAAKRAGRTSTAREALTRFLQTYPTSSRAGEASALLGWILYDAGELEAAKQRFELAAHDRVPKVKESAQKGLEAIKRKQAAP